MRLPSWDAWGITRAKPHGVAPEQAQLWGTGLLKQSSLHRLRGSSRVCFPPPPRFHPPWGSGEGSEQQQAEKSPAASRHLSSSSRSRFPSDFPRPADAAAPALNAEASSMPLLQLHSTGAISWIAPSRHPTLLTTRNCSSFHSS